MTHNTLHNNRGSALLISLALLGMLTLVAIVAVDQANTDIDLSYNNMHAEQAFYVAEAGLDHAQSLIAADHSWNAGLNDIAFNGGAYSVTVTDSSVNPALADSIVLTSTATLSSGKSTLEAVVMPERFYPYRYGLYADKAISIDNSVGTDSYNSDSGSYASTVENLYGSVGANGTILIENNPTIAGNVHSATAGGITITGSGTVLGDTSSTCKPKDYSQLVSADAFAWAETQNKAPLGMYGSFAYHNWSRNVYVAGGQTMTLQSGVYVFNNVTLDQSAQIKVAPGADVIIYMTGDMTMRNKSMINDGGKPASLQIYSSGDHFTMGQSAEFTGTVVAPYVDFNLSNYADFYGAMMADRVDLSNNPGFHYDRSLGTIAMGYTGRIVRVAWREM